jgi:ADP-dependent phosphofructokinase/glucokinase
VVCFRKGGTKDTDGFFVQDKARGGGIAGSMATTRNTVMRKKTPFHVPVFRKQASSLHVKSNAWVLFVALGN